MEKLLQAIISKRDELDRLRPLPREVLSNLEHYYDLEITYSSNAIEGNTLTMTDVRSAAGAIANPRTFTYVRLE